MSTTPEETQTHATEHPATEQAAEEQTPNASADQALDQSDDQATQEQPATDEAPTTQTASSGGADTEEASEELVREGEIAADFLETLLDIADLDGDLEVDVEGERAAVAIVDSEDGAAPRRLVGPGGSVLEALQELTRLAVQAETGDRSRLMLDVAGYRADRRGALVSQAQTLIAEVKDSGERRSLEPMTAFERKVVHDEVLAAGLTSESEGAEPSRYVVILPEG